MVWTAFVVAAAMQSPTPVEETPPAPKVRVVRKATPDELKGTPTDADQDTAKRPEDPAVPTPQRLGPNPKLKSRFVANLSIPRPRPRAESIPSYRVAIRMKNGRRFTGLVIRDRHFHDSVYMGEHHKALIYNSETEFKLSYVDGLDGDLSLPWWHMKKLEVREVLDDAGLLAFETEQHEARVNRREAARKAGQEQGVAAGEAAAEDEEVSLAELMASMSEEDKLAMPEVLTRFPPLDGWGEERKRQIEWRRTVVGVFPDEQEAEFLEVFDEWSAAFEAWSAQQTEKRNADEKALEAKKQEVRKLQEKLEEADRKNGRETPVPEDDESSETETGDEIDIESGGDGSEPPSGGSGKPQPGEGDGKKG